MKNRIYTILAVIVTAVMFSSVAYAQTSINQNRALSGGVTAGDTPGFPVTISRPGSFKLTSNLRVPATTGVCVPGTTPFRCGILIKANNITLDLNGFAIIGVGPPDQVFGIATEGVSLPPLTTFSGIAVRNGTVTNFEQGIALGCNECEVERIRAIQNSANGINIVGGDAIVRNNNASHNGPIAPSCGICVGPGALTATALVTENDASNNAGNGLQIGINSTISGNTASKNGGDGITTGNTTNSTVSGNTASANSGRGIVVDCPANVYGNTARGNAGGDIVLTGTTTDCTRTSNNPAP